MDRTPVFVSVMFWKIAVIHSHLSSGIYSIVWFACDPLYRTKMTKFLRLTAFFSKKSLYWHEFYISWASANTHLSVKPFLLRFNHKIIRKWHSFLTIPTVCINKVWLRECMKPQLWEFYANVPSKPHLTNCFRRAASYATREIDLPTPYDVPFCIETATISHAFWVAMWMEEGFHRLFERVCLAKELLYINISIVSSWWCRNRDGLPVVQKMWCTSPRDAMSEKEASRLTIFSSSKVNWIGLMNNTCANTFAN